LKVLLEQALAKFEVVPLADQLNRAGVPCAPVLDMAQAFSHPQTQHNGMVWEQGGYRSVGAPVHLSRTPASLRKPPPALEE
jgi:crotonobetainyl-CoA:carnitine CoA-transferase CaiB-like acyl-CoA transferase